MSLNNCTFGSRLAKDVEIKSISANGKNYEI
jgi:hypothetical protein